MTNNQGMLRLSNQVWLETKSSKLFCNTSGDLLLRFDRRNQNKLLKNSVISFKGVDDDSRNTIPPYLGECQSLKLKMCELEFEEMPTACVLGTLGASCTE